MTLITKSEELMAVSVRQGVELAAIEAKVLLGYLEGHDYSLLMDDKFHLALHDNQDGENANSDQPYTIRDCIDFCQEMNSELLLEEAGKEGGDPDYFSELQKDELILGMMMLYPIHRYMPLGCISFTPCRSEIVGMQVTDHTPRFESKHSRKMRNRFFKKRKVFPARQLAYMLTQ